MIKFCKPPTLLHFWHSWVTNHYDFFLLVTVCKTQGEKMIRNHTSVEFFPSISNAIKKILGNNRRASQLASITLSISLILSISHS